jgi:membrane-bound lytic murein transglycosylase C
VRKFSLLKIIVISSALLVSPQKSTFAQNNPFEDMLNRLSGNLAQQARQITAGDSLQAATIRAASERQYNDWRRADSLARVTFLNSVAQMWGDKKVSTKKEWVAYSDDKSFRTDVDFENGTATVEVIVPANSDEESRNKKLETAIVALISERGASSDYEVEGVEVQPLGEQPVMEGQLTSDDGTPVTASDADKYAKEKIESGEVEVSQIESTAGPESGMEYVKLSVTVPLVPNHFRVRASKYLDTVRHYSEKYNLDIRIVFGLMHTESYFNPAAVSHAPAYGLMQLVPTSGGRDAYKYAKGEEICPTKEYLFVANNNIELGCAYLALVKDSYFGDVVNLKSRYYCTICSYNTGPGNVSRAFTGRRKVSEAIKIINTMSPDEVLQMLKENLPYEETREYIVRVLDRAPYYEEWRN